MATQMDDDFAPKTRTFPTWGWIALGVSFLASGGAVAAAYVLGGQTAHDAALAVERERAAEAKKKAAEAQKKIDELATRLPGFEKKIREATGDRSLEEHIFPSIVKVLSLRGGRPAGSGSGFFVNDQQWIATNHHVIHGAETVKVITHDGKEWDIEELLIDQNPFQDLAIIKPKQNIPTAKPVKFPSRRLDLKPGTLVYAVGNPGKHEFVVTKGILTRMTTRANMELEVREGLEQVGAAFFPQDFDASILEFDARIYPGNSGGPLFNADLELIGVNTWGYSFRNRYRPEVSLTTYGAASHAMYTEEAIAKVTKETTMSFVQNNKLHGRIREH